MDHFTVIFWFTIAIAVLTLAIFLFCYIRNKKYEAYVLAHSRAIQKLETINSKYHFYDNEKKYLEEFAKGNFDPYLLFESNDAERAAKHPMAKWRAANLKK